MTISKEAKSLGMSWEKEYGYSQAVKVDNTIYVSGRVSHDDKGNIVGRGDMQVQMRQFLRSIQGDFHKHLNTAVTLIERRMSRSITDHWHLLHHNLLQ